MIIITRISVDLILNIVQTILCGLKSSFTALVNSCAYNSNLLVIANPHLSCTYPHKFKSISATNRPSLVLDSPGVLLASGAAT